MSMPTDFPIRPIKRPSDLAGIVNGEVPEGLLVPIGRRGSKMHHTAARGWRCITAHLEPHLAELGVDGWDVSSIDPRTYQRQCEMFDGRKYPGGRYLPQEMWAAWEAKGGRWGKRDDGSIQQYTWQAQDRTSPEQWRRMYPLAMAAKPGTSPHGDGLAVDLAVDDDDDSIADPITEAVVRFLMADDLALRCGFAWSTVQEPWHLQWFVGDDMPALVVEWESAQEHPVVIDPPAINLPEDAMDVYDIDKDTEKWARVAVTGGRFKWVRGDGNAAVDRKLAKGQATLDTLTHSEFRDLVRSLGTEGPSPWDPTQEHSVPGGDEALDFEWKAAARV